MCDAIRNIDAVTALMTALRKGLYQITICTSARETAASRQSHPTFPPGRAFPSAPGYLCSLCSPTQCEYKYRTEKIGEYHCVPVGSSTYFTLGSPLQRCLQIIRQLREMAQWLGPLLERDKDLGMPGARSGICTFLLWWEWGIRRMHRGSKAARGQLTG